MSKSGLERREKRERDRNIQSQRMSRNDQRRRFFGIMTPNHRTKTRYLVTVQVSPDERISSYSVMDATEGKLLHK